ncbi:MAG: TonB-dependent receptor [Bacteroidetes bacterium]|nr:TonB-dependent receptor [Bacteroidota bacterium]
MKKKAGYFIILLFFSITSVIGQTGLIIIDKSYEDLTWNEFVIKLESHKNVQFFYDKVSIPDFRIKLLSDSVSLETVLRFNLSSRGINFSFDKHGHIFINPNEKIETSLAQNYFDALDPKTEAEDSMVPGETSGEDYLKTGKHYITEKVTIGNKKAGAGKRNFVLSGKVISSEDDTPIVGGTIYIVERETGTTTDDNGEYSLTLRKGNYTLLFNSIESEEKRFKIVGLSDGELNVFLTKKMFELDEVEIRSESDNNVRGIQMGYIKLDAKEIKEVPVALGERDVIKVALLLPGVQSVGEGAAGFNVRGSPADQNLFYISRVPIYNSSHFFGFFSAFNPDVIDEFTLYKSNIPAVYGGRLSSIFEIATKQGNLEHFSARGGISPITARLMVEGPIKKNKASYLAGFRTTYSDWVLRLMNNPELKNSRASFSDAVINLAYIVNEKNRINVFGYYSRDNAELANQTDFEYDNIGTSISWFHSFNRNLDFNLSLNYTNYRFQEQNKELEIAAYNQDYRINHTELDWRFSFRPHDQHNVSAGITAIYYHINNGQLLPLNDNSLIVPKYLGAENGIESSIYLSDEWKLSPRLILYGGLRYNLYSNTGPSTVFEYKPGAPRTPENVTDTVQFGKGEIIKPYGGLDFRFAATFLINPNLSVKTSYNRLHQYIFMLSNTIALAPTDKWKLADSHIEPMVGDQISVGMYSNFSKVRYEASVEAYYKKVNNLVEYRDGADLLVNEYPEQEVLQGNLNSYGIEFMIKKISGRLNGWINYTYSKAEVQVVDAKTGENNNFGLTYPANWDKPHAFNLVANYKLSKRMSISTDLVYATGRPVTYPTAIYYQDGQQILHYSQRNEYRLPDYFRWDASIIWEGNLKKKKFLHGSWIFSVYNITGRKNAYSVYFQYEDGVVNGYKLSIFGTQIFSITYDFKLGNIND